MESIYNIKLTKNSSSRESAWHPRFAPKPNAAFGVVYRTGDSVTTGMALGGIDTGCLDLAPSGLLGYSTIFNSHVPRRGPIKEPILGLSVGGKTWVLCKPDVRAPSWVGVGPKGPAEPVRMELVLDGVETAEAVHY